MPALLSHFSEIAADYDVLLCDVWGVVHNGVVAFSEACDALVRARQGGATVVFITNAPRPSDVVARQLAALHVPRETYDAIVSSGDVTRAVIGQRAGQTVFHLGPDRDIEIFTGLNVKFAPLERADYVICSGLDDDERDTPEDYRARLEGMLARKVFMVCGNPDVVVDRGDKRIYCAGALADLYVSMGGEVLYAGKPYRPIYEMALTKTGHKAELSRVLAIGDSVRTDLSGARDFGIDFLFVTSGIHAQELDAGDDALTAVLDGERPKAAMRKLMW